MSLGRFSPLISNLSRKSHFFGCAIWHLQPNGLDLAPGAAQIRAQRKDCLSQHQSWGVLDKSRHLIFSEYIQKCSNFNILEACSGARWRWHLAVAKCRKMAIFSYKKTSQRIVIYMIGIRIKNYVHEAFKK